MVIELPQILLVEDDPADVELTQYTLKNSKIQVNLHVVGDGVEPWLFCGKRGSLARPLVPT